MSLPNEPNGLRGAKLALQVCHSAAGYYLGYWCDRCGPRSRETGYFQFERTAKIELMCVWRGLKPRKVRD